MYVHTGKQYRATLHDELLFPVLSAFFFISIQFKPCINFQ